MTLQEVLFKPFVPPPVLMTRRITNIGIEQYEGGYVPSSLQRTLEKRRAAREKDHAKVVDLLRDGTPRSANQIAVACQWGHNKACNIIDGLLREKRVVRQGRKLHKTGGPQTYFYTTA